MLKPLDLYKRLSLLLEAKQVTLVDMNDLQSQRDALNLCRAPALGWEDYQNGEKYKPPTFANDLEHYYGPPDDGNAWTRNKAGEPVRVKPNPNSSKFGGVRPWSPEEIVAVMVDEGVTEGFFPRGIRSLIRRFGRHWMASHPNRPFKVGEWIGAALDHLNRAIMRDEGRRGVEFTKYLALNMDLSGGAPPGYKNEHRVTRGILSNLSKQIGRVISQIESGDYNAEALIANIGAIGSTEATLGDADPSIPRHKNPLGGWAKPLRELFLALSDAIKSGDAVRLRELAKHGQKLYVDVEEQEEIFRGEGMAHGVLGRQPRDLPAIGTIHHRHEASTYLIHVTDPDLTKMDLEKVRNQPKSLRETDIVLQRDPESDEPAMRHFTTVKAETEHRALSAARDAYAKEYELPPQLVAFLPFSAEISEEESSRAGYHSISGLTVPSASSGKEIAHPGLPTVSDVAQSDPEFKAELAQILYSLRYGAVKQKIGQARRALEVVEQLASVMRYARDPSPRPRLEARPDPRTGRGDFRAGGWEIVDTEKDQIVSRAETEEEAAKVLERINNPVGTSFKYVGTLLSRAKLGDLYYEDLADLTRSIALAVQAEDTKALAEAGEELEMSASMIQQDIEADPEQHEPLITELEYRIALRKLGIDDYPEKGTVNDPEIDEHGNLSLWAQAGYPMVRKETSGGKGEMAGTLFAPGQREGGEPMVDKHIAHDLGISATSVGAKWRKLHDRLMGLVQELFEHHAWAGDLDPIDLELLLETCNKLAIIEIAQIYYGSQVMLAERLGERCQLDGMTCIRELSARLALA